MAPEADVVAIASPNSQQHSANREKLRPRAGSAASAFPCRGADALETTETAHVGQEICPGARRGGRSATLKWASP